MLRRVVTCFCGVPHQDNAEAPSPAVAVTRPSPTKPASVARSTGGDLFSTGDAEESEAWQSGLLLTVRATGIGREDDTVGCADGQVSEAAVAKSDHGPLLMSTLTFNVMPTSSAPTFGRASADTADCARSTPNAAAIAHQHSSFLLNSPLRRRSSGNALKVDPSPPPTFPPDTYIDLPSVRGNPVLPSPLPLMPGARSLRIPPDAEAVASPTSILAEAHSGRLEALALRNAPVEETQPASRPLSVTGVELSKPSASRRSSMDKAARGSLTIPQGPAEAIPSSDGLPISPTAAASYPGLLAGLASYEAADSGITPFTEAAAPGPPGPPEFETASLPLAGPFGTGRGYGFLDAGEPRRMRRTPSLMSIRDSGAMSPPRLSSLYFGAGGTNSAGMMQTPPSPQRSSLGMVPSRLSLSGAGSLLLDNGALCDVTTPQTGQVGEQTVLEMSVLAPALDLWTAGAQVSPQSRIAQGAYGVVYRGLWHGCNCAVKVMLAASAENLSTQLTEVFLCKALSCHPNIVQTFDCNVWRITSETLMAAQLLADGGGGFSLLGGHSASPLPSALPSYDNSVATPFAAMRHDDAGWPGSIPSNHTANMVIGNAIQQVPAVAAGGQNMLGASTDLPRTFLTGQGSGVGVGVGVGLAPASNARHFPPAPTSSSALADSLQAGCGHRDGARPAPATAGADFCGASQGRSLNAPATAAATAMSVSALLPVGSEGAKATGGGLWQVRQLPASGGPAESTTTSSVLGCSSSPLPLLRPGQHQPLTRQAHGGRDAVHAAAAGTAVSPAAAAAAVSPAWSSRSRTRALGPVSEERPSSVLLSEGTSGPQMITFAIISQPLQVGDFGSHSISNPGNGSQLSPGPSGGPDAAFGSVAGAASSPSRPAAAVAAGDCSAVEAAVERPLEAPSEPAPTALAQRSPPSPPQQGAELPLDTLAALHPPSPFVPPGLESSPAGRLQDESFRGAVTATAASPGAAADVFMGLPYEPPADATVVPPSAFGPAPDSTRRRPKSTQFFGDPQLQVHVPHRAASSISNVPAVYDSNPNTPRGASTPSAKIPSAAPHSSHGGSGQRLLSSGANAFLDARWPSQARALGPARVPFPAAPVSSQSPNPGVNMYGSNPSPPSIFLSSTQAVTATGPGYGTVGYGAGVGNGFASSPMSSGHLPSVMWQGSARSERLLGPAPTGAPSLQARSAVLTGDDGDAEVAEAGARSLAQVLSQLSAREGQLAVVLVMEECDRGSLQQLLTKTAAAAAAAEAAAAAAAAVSSLAGPVNGFGTGIASGHPPNHHHLQIHHNQFSQQGANAGPAYAATPKGAPLHGHGPPGAAADAPWGLYVPFSGGGRYSMHAALRALVLTAKEIALGMAFLHLNNIIHGDLKPGNVLLKSSRQDQRGFNVKISDFGLGRVLHPTSPHGAPHRDGAFYAGGGTLASADNSEADSPLPEPTLAGGERVPQCSTSVVQEGALDGTVPYLAPEVINHNQRSKASDVWAYGVMLWQLVTGRRPYEGLLHIQIMAAVCSGEQLLPWPSNVHPAILELGRACLSFKPQDRPTFAQVVRMLTSLEAQLPR